MFLFPNGGSLDEFAVAGALRGKAVDLVPFETIPLDVATMARIVLEVKFQAMA